MEYPFKDLLPLDEVLEREGYYKDWTHLDPQVFYSLTQISKYIKTKGYGVDVRLLIAQLAEHFGLKTTQVVDLANLLQQKFTNLEGVTQSFTNNINLLVAQMEADKDAVISNATVDSEVILARGGKETLEQRLDETDKQLAYNALKTSRILVVDTFLSIGDSDDSLAIQAAIDAATDGDTVMFLPRTYHANFAQIEAKNDIVLDGNACSIIYNGVYTMADEIKARLFSVRNSKRITLKNMKLYGKMFDGLNKESMPTNPIEDNIFTTLHHTAIKGAYSEDIKLENVQFEDFCQSLELDYVEGFELNDLKSKDNRVGYRLYKTSRGRISNVDSQDARYTLDHIPSGIDEPLVTSIGASGSGMLIDACEDVIVENSSVQRAGTNSFRVQGGSKSIVLRDCWTDQARRHGFSVYGQDNEVTFDRVLDKRVADPDFWNGKDYSNTFRRPHVVTSPTGISISEIVDGFPNFVEIIHSQVSAIKRDTPPVSDNVGGAFQAVAPRRLIMVAKNNVVKINGLKLRGYTTSHAAEIMCDNSDINGLDIEGNLLSGEVGKFNLRADTVGSNFTNITSKDGMGPTFHGEKNVIKDIHSTDADYHGINIQSDDSYVDGCIITNGNARGSDGFGIYVNGTKGVVFGTNIVRDVRTVPKLSRAYGLSPTVTDFEPGKMIAQGIAQPLYNDNGTNNFISPIYGKAATTSASTAIDVTGVRNDLNTVIQRLKNANLMS